MIFCPTFKKDWRPRGCKWAAMFCYWLRFCVTTWASHAVILLQLWISWYLEAPESRAFLTTSTSAHVIFNRTFCVQSVQLSMLIFSNIWRNSSKKQHTQELIIHVSQAIRQNVLPSSLTKVSFLYTQIAWKDGKLQGESCVVEYYFQEWLLVWVEFKKKVAERMDVKNTLSVGTHIRTWVEKDLKSHFWVEKTRSKTAIFDHRGLIDFGNKSETFLLYRRPKWFGTLSYSYSV